MPELSAAAKTWPDVLAPFSDLVKTLVGPAAEQYGLAWGESAYLFRRKRLVRLLEKASKQLAEAKIEPHAVKYPLLHDILDRGSLEENDSLQDLWANLLANAAGEETLVMTAFVDILKSLSFDEAVFLTMLFNGAIGDTSAWNLDTVQYGNLKRLGLIMTEQERLVPKTAAGLDAYAMRVVMGHTEELYYLTDLGMAFINACTAPTPENQD